MISGPTIFSAYFSKGLEGVSVIISGAFILRDNLSRDTVVSQR